MAIVQNFSPTDYIVKTQTLTVTAGQTFKLGSPYSGGSATDVFTNVDFSVKQSGVEKTNGIDFTLTDVDKRLSADYGYTFYTGIKSINITGEIEVTYRCHGSFVDAEIINQHEDRLNAHDTAIIDHSSHLVAIDNTDVAQNNRLSATEAAIVEETENRTADVTYLQSEIDLEVELRTEADALHANNTDIHITAAERAAWNGKTNTYFVATIAKRDALPGLKVGDRVVVWDDGDSKRAVYFYGGSSTWYKDSDPDWENISLAWSALSGIPTNVAAVVGAAGVTAEATSNTLAIRDGAGRLKVASPSDRADASNKGYVDDQCASISSGSGFVAGASSATDGNIVLFNGTTGKSLKDSGYSPSSFMASNAACGRLSWNGSRISIDGSANNAAVSYADSAGSVTSLSGHNVTELTNNAGYISSIGRCYPRLSNGNDVNFVMSVQNTGEPLWLWGGTDGTNMYPYKQGNLSVNYANNSGTVGSWSASSLIGSSSLSTNGYIKLASGVIIQWGRRTAADVPSGGYNEVVAFPYGSFPSSVFTIVASIENNNLNGVEFLETYTHTVSGFSYVLREHSSGTQACRVNWIAIGC